MKLRLWRKQESIMGKIKAYLDQVDICRDLFMSTIGGLIADPSQVQARQITEVHDAEGKADDLRREIELTLYKKSLIPESRGDVLGLIEAVDKIPNVFERIVVDIHTQQLAVPKKFREKIMELIHVNIEAYNSLRDAVRDFFYNRRDSLEQLGHIDERESRSDKLERKIQKAVFASELQDGQKILIRDLIIRIGNISDRAEDCADRLVLAVVKRSP